MGTSVLDGRPTPGAQIGWYPEALMRVACTGCGKANELHIGRLVVRHRVDPTTRFHELELRLRCATCGAPGRIRQVRRWR